jgi:ATP-dependent RNA helicase DeaD
MLSRMEPGKPALVVAPPEQLDEWGVLISDLVRDASLRVQVARGAARAMRRLKAEPLDVVVTTLETALLLIARSALRIDAVGALLLAWPESLPDDDGMMPLMQDLSRDAQRIVFTSDPGRVAGAADRYARKALTIGVPPAPVAPAGPVRTVSTSWSGRVRALADVIELLDPASLVIWTADRGHHEAMLPLISIQPDLQVVVGNAPPAEMIVAFDLPTPDQLRQLAEAGEVVLLVPAGTESYVQHAASPRRPLQLPGPVEAARSAEATQRATIQKVLETNDGGRALLTLAPLFERYDATTVAAALFELWRGAAPGTEATPAAAEASGTAKVYVGAGKKDGVTANDLVAVLTKELRFDRTRIGRIELRDAYSLVELPAQDAERLAGQLNGTTIRRKRVTARVDRGPTRPGGTERGGRPARRTNPR